MSLLRGGVPKLNTVPGTASPMPRRGGNNLLQSVSCASPNAAECLLCPICNDSALLAYIQVDIQHNPFAAFSAKLLLRQSVPVAYWCMGLFHPMQGALCFFFTFIHFLLAQSSCLPMSLWIKSLLFSMSTIHPLNLLQSAKLWIVHSVLISLLVMEIWNKHSQ